MKIFKNIIIVSMALGIAACSDFLETEDLTHKTIETYYTSVKDFDEALVGCYDGLQLIYSSGTSMILASDVMSDLCFGGLGVGDIDNYRMIDEFDLSVEPSEVDMFKDTWKAYYKGLNRVNTLLLKINEIDWSGEEAKKARIIGEASFLRAYYYFDMVRLWERVPLLTEPTAELVPQATPEEIYTLIASDLKVAIENCTDQTYNQIPPSDFGHATKWAAEALMARVYLFYTGYYGAPNLVNLVSKAEALAYLEDVISFSEHDLVDSYYDLWPAAAQYKAIIDGKTLSQSTYAGEVNKEVVFSIKHTYTSDYNGNTDGNHWIVMNGIRNEAVKEYGYGNGWGANTVSPDFYNNWDATDTRRDASVMAIAEEGINYGKISDVKEYTGYFTKKYIPLCDSVGKQLEEILGGVDMMIGQYQDYFAIRYADVLLMAAELSSPNALNYVNKVHKRAGYTTDLTSVDKDVIYTERMYEFAFEGIRFYDLLRYNNTLQYAANMVSFNGIVKTGNVDSKKVIDGNNLIKTRGLVMIPKTEITLSGNSEDKLTQNPGWE